MIASGHTLASFGPVKRSTKVCQNQMALFQQYILWLDVLVNDHDGRLM